MSNGIVFVSEDPEELQSSLTKLYEKLTGKTVQPGSPEYQFILWAANVIVLDRAGINYTGNQNIPRYARGGNLDALCDLFHNLTRKAATAATVTMKFNISAAQSSAVLIPAGTRVTTGNQSIVFATAEDVYIAVGDTSATVTARCEATGTAGNGYVAGQLATLVDVFPYYSSCANTDASDGGADQETDKELYERMVMSMDSYSTAGPQGGYEYWAKSVSTKIADVKAIQPAESLTNTLNFYTLSGVKYAFLGGSDLKTDTLAVYAHGSSTAAAVGTDYSADYTDGLLTITILSTGALASATQIDVTIDNVLAGCIYIYVLMDDGSIATSEIKAQVLAACNQDDVRPLTDSVNVQDPEMVPYGIDLTFYIVTGATSSSSEIAQKVADAVSEFKSWQSGKLGRDINPSKLLNMVQSIDGVKRIVIRSPAFQQLRDGSNGDVPQVAAIAAVNVVNGGFEDE